MFRALLITGVVLLAGNAGAAQACGHRYYPVYYTSCCVPVYTPCCESTPVVQSAPAVQTTPVVYSTPVVTYSPCCTPTYVSYAPVATYYYPTWSTYYNGRCWGRRWR
jgi:hypothetical protein